MEAKAKKKETKREKFVRMAEARTIKIISMVRLLGNCSNRLAYEYYAVWFTKAIFKYKLL